MNFIKVLFLIVIFSVLCFPVYAEMPVPKVKNSFLNGVQEIVIVSTTSLEDYVLNPKDIDPTVLVERNSKNFQKNLTKMMAGKKASIHIRVEDPAKFIKEKYKNPTGAVVEVLLSYRTQIVGEKKIYVGSIVPLLWKPMGGYSDYTNSAYAENFSATSFDDFLLELDKADEKISDRIYEWLSH